MNGDQTKINNKVWIDKDTRSSRMNAANNGFGLVNAMIQAGLLKPESVEEAFQQGMAYTNRVYMFITDGTDLDTSTFGREKPKKTTPKKVDKPPKEDEPKEGLCTDCNKKIEADDFHSADAIIGYSTRTYGVPLCKDCQEKH